MTAINTQIKSKNTHMYVIPEYRQRVKCSQLNLREHTKKIWCSCQAYGQKKPSSCGQQRLREDFCEKQEQNPRSHQSSFH